MLPSKLHFKNKVESSFAKNFTSVINCQNTNNAGLGSTTIINLPCMNNQFLSGQDSTLSFTVNLRNASGTNSTYARMNKCGAHGFIQRVRIYHGSSLLQDVDEYGALCSMLMPFQHDSDYMFGKGALLSGAGQGTGQDFGAIDTGDEASLNFNISLLSILSLTSNYVPCFAMQSAPIRLEIQWVSSVHKAVGASHALVEPTTAAALITDIRYIANYVEVSDMGMSIINQANNGVVEWSVQSFANYQHNTALTTGIDQVSMSIPAKFNSLKALYYVFREHSAGAVTYLADDSCSFSLSEYSTRIGSNVIPSQKPKNTVEFLAEMHRALGSVGSRIEPHSYTSAQYSALSSTAAAALSGAFAVGCETESYSSCDMTSTYQGLDTSTSDVFFQPTFGAASGNKNIRIDCFASYDQLITIQNSVCVVQF